jgi:hypothetical protein
LKSRINTKFRDAHLPPPPARDRHIHNSGPTRQRKHLAHGSSWIALAAGGRSTNVVFHTYVQDDTTRSLWHTFTDAEGVDGQTRRSVCTASRTKTWARMTAILGADGCHIMHCFSALGVWPPFSLTCISLNQGFSKRTTHLFFFFLWWWWWW